MKNQLSLLKYLIFFILCAGMQWVHAQTYRVDIVSGNSQVNAYPNQQPQAFIARAVDTVTGLPVPNVLVVWAVNGLATATPPPTGTLSYFNGIPVALGTGTYSQTTDANGEISMLFTPGFNLNMGIAICPGAPPIFYTSPPCITFGLSLNPAAQSVKVVLVSGTPQNSTSPNPQPLPFVAQAIDPLTGAVVPNASLYWQVGGVTGNPTVPPNTATVSFNGSTFGWAAGRFNTTTDTAGNSQVSFASSYNNPQIVIACPSAVTLGTGNCATYTVNAASIAAINRVISVSALSQVNAFPNAQAQAFVARLVDGTNQPIANTGVVIDAGIPNAPVGTTTGDVINGTPVTSAQPINGTTDAAGQISITYRTGSATARYLRVCPVTVTAPTDCNIFTISVKGAPTAQEQEAIKSVVTSLGVMSVTSIRTQFNNIQRRFQYIRGGAGAGFSTDINVNASVDGQQIPVPGGQSSQGATSNEGAGSSDETAAGIKQGKWGAYIMGGVDVLKVKGDSGFKIGTNGITAGADYRVSRRILVGGALGFMRGSTEIANGAGDQTATGTSITLYGSFEPAPAWFLDLGLSSGRNSFDIKRTQSDGGVAKASTSGNSTGLTFTGGYSLRSNGLLLTPYGRVDTLKVAVDGFTEEGTSALIVGPQSLRSTVLSAGGIAQYSVNTSFGIVVPQARLEFQRQSQNSAQGVSARLVGSDVQVLVTPDLEIDKTSGTFGLGLSTQFRRGLSAFADYEQLFGKSNTSQYRLSAGLKLEF